MGSNVKIYRFSQPTFESKEHPWDLLFLLTREGKDGRLPRVRSNQLTQMPPASG